MVKIGQNKPFLGGGVKLVVLGEVVLRAKKGLNSQWEFWELVAISAKKGQNSQWEFWELVAISAIKGQNYQW